MTTITLTLSREDTARVECFIAWMLHGDSAGTQRLREQGYTMERAAVSLLLDGLWRWEYLHSKLEPAELDEPPVVPTWLAQLRIDERL